MKKFNFSLNIYGVAIIVFLFALLRLSHAIIVLTHKNTAIEANQKKVETDYQPLLKSQSGFPHLHD